MRKGIFLEALGANEGKGASAFLVRVIRAGLSHNGKYYSDAVLREAVPLFEGCRVYVKGDAEHLAGKGKDLRNLEGRLIEARFESGSTPDTGEVLARFELIEPQGAIATKLREAWDRKMTDLFGLSVDAVGIARGETINGQKVCRAVKIEKVDSVDLIVEPGAGGGIVNFIEAVGEKNTPKNEVKIMDLEKLIALLKSLKPELLEGKDESTLTIEEVKALLAQAIKPEEKKEVPAAEPEKAAFAEAKPVNNREHEKASTEKPSAIDIKIQQFEARVHLREALNASNLPDAAKTRLKKDFEARETFTADQIDASIKAEREYLATFTESGAVQGLGAGYLIPGESWGEKTDQRLDAFFDREHKDHKSAGSFREAYIEITGDKRVTGFYKDCNRTRMREALDSQSFGNVLGNAITRRMIADYTNQSNADVWKHLALITHSSDFRTQERTRFGGYGDLPKVAEKGAYAALTSPTDEKASFAVEKRGGTESITIEMIKNDDMGTIQQIPIKLSRAAKKTLGKFALDFLRLNPTIYDSKALFHADHKNLGTAALSAASFAAARLAMMKQTELDSDEPLGIGPRYIWVPAELEEVAYNLFRRDANNDETFVQTLKPVILPVWYWQDQNDWAVTADPNDIATVEISFLDGEEEPQIFIQDSPTQGSMFANDTITYKIRHIYGGNVLDYRGMYKGVVA